MGIVYIQTESGINRLDSVHTPDFIGRSDCVINPKEVPDLSAVTIVKGTFIPFTEEQMKAKAVEDFEAVKTAKLAELAEARWLAETGGLTLPDGTVIKTDRESQGLLTAAAVMAKFDPTMTVEWKAATGWIDLDAATVIQLAGAVRQHVQGQFSKERALSEKVNACTSAEEVRGVVWG